MVVLQAIGAAGNAPCPACKGLIIESGVSDWSVEVLPRQCLTPELAVVDYPAIAFVVPLSTDNCRLIGKKLPGLCRGTG